MSGLDWLVVAATLGLIIAYGLWRTRSVRDIETYLRGGRDVKWWTVALSVMATQASAITFLSTPGQAYEDGLGFIQFYLGVPLAMVLCAAFVTPLYFRLKVYTAYEYLERRFDQKTRQLTALLFLVQRGLGAGLSIYAPAIILSTVFGWSLTETNLGIGLLVTLYTVSGGTRAVNQTQTHQMAVILVGMAVAFAVILHKLPAHVSFGDALGIAGALGKMKALDLSPRLDTRYTLWSGLTGGLFVQLAYFGTDQSQVQRYLSGASLGESRLGLLANGLVKIPMQFAILLTGILVLVFYQFHRPPVFFNEAAFAKARQGAQGAKTATLEADWDSAFAARRGAIDALLAARHGADEAATRAAAERLRTADRHMGELRHTAQNLVRAASPRAETKDSDYIFIRFIAQQLPAGLVGLLVAVIFCAAMSATASALNALGTTSVVDFYRRSARPEASDRHYLWAARGFTVFWGIAATAFAAFASMLDNLIQAVNILGSLFYGPMLGVFVVGFCLPRVRGTAVFVGALAAEAAVFALFLGTQVGFLWYNVVGCGVVVVTALVLTAARDWEGKPRSAT